MTKPLTQDARDFAFDAFREDMARHQRMVGQMPDTRRNEEMAAEALNQSERKRAEAKPAPPVRADPRKPKTVLGVTSSGHKIIRVPDVDSPKVQRVLDPLERQYARRLDARVQLLLSKRERGPLNQPSWRERVMSAMAVALRDRRRGQAELVAVCEASSETFGDWKKDPARPLHFI